MNALRLDYRTGSSRRRFNFIQTSSGFSREKYCIFASFLLPRNPTVTSVNGRCEAFLGLHNTFTILTPEQMFFYPEQTFLKPGASASLHNTLTIDKICQKNFNKKLLTIKYKCGIIKITNKKKPFQNFKIILKKVLTNKKYYVIINITNNKKHLQKNKKNFKKLLTKQTKDDIIKT